MKTSILILSVATTLLIARGGSHLQHGRYVHDVPQQVKQDCTLLGTTGPNEQYVQKVPQQTMQNYTIIGTSVLNDEQKHTLAYMWNEEKLAKDIYLAINEINPHYLLYNIATKSETRHQASVQRIVEAYDLNISSLVDYSGSYSEAELEALAPGEYAIDELQTLYDTLYLKGIQSTQDALEVGCLVEVTDINDLDEDIQIAQGADDVVNVFENLRDGSYRHYWAFDGALKAMGISDGCCVLGEEYCKTSEDYPQASKGKNTLKDRPSRGR